TEDQETLVQLIFSTKAVALHLDNSPQLIRKGLDLEIFMRICAPTLKEVSSNDKNFVDSFRVPHAFLPILIGYNRLNIPSLT
ncbi:hypothetical protein PMAYCL1PPCAC_26422, partial [Pristionchus mayeri]